MEAEFTALGRREVIKLVLERKEDRVETNLKVWWNNVSIILQRTSKCIYKIL